MTNKLLLPLVLIVLALFGGAMYVLTSGLGGDGSESVEELGPGDGDIGLVPSSARPEELTYVADAEPEPERQAMVEAEQPTLEKVAREATSLPSNAVWVEGLMIFPTKMPLDAGGVEVTARGRRFNGKDDPRREYVTSISREGRFRVAFAKSTRTGWIDIEGRYLYMDEKLSLKMSKLPDEIVVEPKLGGVVSGKLTPPLGMSWTPEIAEETLVSLVKWSSGRFNKTVKVRGDGTFELTGLPPANNYNLSVKSNYWMEHGESNVQVKAGEVTEVAAKLAVGASVLGKVVDSEGNARAAVTVELMCEPTESGWHHQTQQTKEDGRFEFRGVVDGDVRLTVSADGAKAVEKELGLMRDGEVKQGLTIEIDEGRSISGFVRWPDGTPASGAWVSAEQDKQTRTFAMMVGGKDAEKAAADGSFRISGLEDKTCVLRASAKAVLEADKQRAESAKERGLKGKLRRRGSTYRVKLEDIEPGTTGVVLILEQGDKVTGKALDDLGQPLTRFLIIARPETGGGSELDDEDGFQRIIISLDGSFEVDGLRDGQWRLTARADDHASSQTVDVTSPGAGEVEFRLPRMGRVHGLVRGPAGEGISGASVFVEQAEEADAAAVRIRGGLWGEAATTDAEGRFEAKDVTPGRKAVYAGMEGFGQSPPQFITLEPGQTLEAITLRMRAGAAITGQVHAAAGRLKDRKISIRGQDNVSYNENAETDSSGRFEVEGLSPGKYRLQLQVVSDESEGEGGFGLVRAFSSATGEGLAHNSIQYVELGEGDRKHVVIGSPPSDPLHVSGRVTSGGEALANHAVSCKSTEDGERNRDATKTDGEGRYTLTVSGAGQYSFSVGSGPNAISSVHEVSESAANIDFELPVCSLSGIVFGPDGAALSGARLELVRFQDTEGHNHLGSSLRATSGEDGSYEFEHLEPGQFYLRAGKQGSWSWRTRNREDDLGAVLIDNLLLEEGQARSGLEIHLERGGSITGTVIGADGNGLSGARIEVLTEDGRMLFGRGRGSSNSSGSFTVSGVGQGSYVVRARKDGTTGAGVNTKVYVDQESEVQLLVDVD